MKNDFARRCSVLNFGYAENAIIGSLVLHSRFPFESHIQALNTLGERILPFVMDNLPENVAWHCLDNSEKCNAFYDLAKNIMSADNDNIDGIIGGDFFEDLGPFYYYLGDLPKEFSMILVKERSEEVLLDAATNGLENSHKDRFNEQMFWWEDLELKENNFIVDEQDCSWHIQSTFQLRNDSREIARCRR